MKAFLLVLILLLPVTSNAASKSQPSFDFDSFSLSHIMRTIYIESFPERSYSFCPELLQDARPVSFRYRAQDGDFRSFFSTYLRNLGYLLEEKGKVDFIRPLPSVAPVSVSQDVNQEIFYYRPKHREGGYLVELLTPLFTGKFTSQRAISTSKDSSLTGQAAGQTPAPQGSALGEMQRQLDQLLFYGSAGEVRALKKLLPQVDTPTAQVMISSVLYEVQTDVYKGSAIQLATSLLGGKLKLNLGAATAADNYVSFAGSSVNAIMRALNTDTRFKVLSSPNLRATSGTTARLVVGEDVPVLGSVTYPQGGAPVQSVDYRSSGVIFSIHPEIRDESITVTVDQQISNFVTTNNGVNNSPTLIKRQIATSVDLVDGDVVVIGGLKQEKDSHNRSGLSFLPDFLSSDSVDKTSSEVLLFLQLKRI
jgi:type II secretory pathway component GspD/PulD (secretin)